MDITFAVRAGARCAAALTLAGFALAAAFPVAAQTATSPGTGLPAEVAAALARGKLPAESVVAMVIDVDGKSPPRVSHRAQVPVNPASVMKLVTTFAALDTLSPAFTWNTQVFTDGAVQNGTLNGNLYIRGQGDPKMVVERLWLLMRRVQGMGIRTIAGDIVLDRTAFETVEQDPGSFDGEPLRPYNASPDALLVNYKSVVMTFMPDRSGGVAQVQYEPPMAGVQMPSSVPLSLEACADWRASLKADFSDATRIRFNGAFPVTCGERVWPVAFAEPRSYAARAVDGMWRELGGAVRGTVREGTTPASLKPAFEMQSPALSEVIRDINKYSNNVMAQQLFLTLSLQQKGRGTLDGSREFIRQWWTDRFGAADAPLMDNGSGLSRVERISAQGLARLLLAAWASPVMPELMSSLPITGVDGTLRRNKAKSAGAAHLKTGTLRDASGVAGYVVGASGRRYVVVMIANHPNAAAVRPAADALVDWAARDQ